jgi:hypothetical protein
MAKESWNFSDLSTDEQKSFIDVIKHASSYVSTIEEAKEDLKAVYDDMKEQYGKIPKKVFNFLVKSEYSREYAMKAIENNSLLEEAWQGYWQCYVKEFNKTQES